VSRIYLQKEKSMQFGISLPAFDAFGDVRYLAQSAAAAEAAGWDGFFIWDHMIYDPTFFPMPDPWVALAAIAMQTQRMRIGALVTPIARRRPWKVARETVSVDLLSEGRLIFGAGLGDPVQWDYGFFGEDEDARARAEKLDEGLEILKGLWTGEMFSHIGKHYRLAPMRFEPKPLQQPHIPIWIGGGWDKRKPQKRAARHDGYMPLKWGGTLTVEDWQEIRNTLDRYRRQYDTQDKPFALVHSGETPGDDLAAATEMVQPYVDFGIDWWIEGIHPWRWGAGWEDPITAESIERMNERIRQGPPRG
jgi:alkanesulfonate monooxygenase SsuD/methylene tetrahydromethanopterin reductase-like flavin-dependent oxidoreductase (luciferase family)